MASRARGGGYRGGGDVGCAVFNQSAWLLHRHCPDAGSQAHSCRLHQSIGWRGAVCPPALSAHPKGHVVLRVIVRKQSTSRVQCDTSTALCEISSSSSSLVCNYLLTHCSAEMFTDWHYCWKNSVKNSKPLRGWMKVGFLFLCLFWFFFVSHTDCSFKFHTDIQRPSQSTPKSFPQATDIQCMLICVLSIWSIVTWITFVVF